MDLLSRIASWLGENEATISAVVGITVLGGVVFAGLRSLVRRQAETRQEKAPAVSPEAASVADSSLPDLDPLTVPGFEGRPAIAVLPFDNLSGDPDQEYFADGIAEDLITRLSAWRKFPVIARNSSFTYKGKPVDVKQVSQELGARYVVEGSVRRSGDRVRIAAQFIDATTGHHVWAETYDRELEDIFALQDEITETIIASMGSQLLRSESERAVRKAPGDLEAWDCMLRAYWHFNKATKEDNAKARVLNERAVELDPDLALGFCGLALTHINDLLYAWTDSPDESLAASVEAAHRAVAIDSEESVSQTCLGVASYMMGHAKKSVAALQRATELDPSQVFAREELAFVLAMTGRPDEAMAEIEKATRLSPHDPAMWLFLNVLGQAHFAASRYSEAVESLEQSRQGKPDFPVNLWMLAASLAHLGRLSDARNVCQELLRLNPNISFDTIKVFYSFAEPELIERLTDGLRKAGLKE